MTDEKKPAPDDLENRQFTAIGGDSTSQDGPQAGPDDAAQKPQASNAQILAGALAAGREVFCLVTDLQSPRRTMSDEALSQWAQAVAPALEKHGIDLGAVIGDFGPEIAAVVSTVILANAVRLGAVAELAAKKQAPTAEAEHGDTIDAQ
jgi:hypothetical protein